MAYCVTLDACSSCSILARLGTMADSEGPRPTGTKKTDHLGLFSQSTKCDSSAREPESESSDIEASNDIQAG